MADARRNQRHLGVDTNVLVAYFDGDHPAHSWTQRLSGQPVALNPTVIHEAYHTLVFKMRWPEADAVDTLTDAMTDPSTLFVNQTRVTTRIGLRLAQSLHLGGRDALILASCLGARVGEFLTFDEDLLALKTVRHGRATLVIRRP